MDELQRRLELQTLLESILGSGNVYYQPGPTIVLKYPCIIYTKSDEDVKHANNLPYFRKRRYTVTAIDRDPDSMIGYRIGQLPLCSFDRFFPNDGLNHDVYSLYY